MIKIMRLDERFIHGQVAFSWTNNLGADCIYIANDEVANDKLRQTSLKLAAPAGVKFFARTIEESKRILNGDKIKKYKVFVIVNNTADALELAKSVEEIRHLNLGNMKKTDSRRVITNSIAVDETDVENIKELVNLGVEVECRAIPTDKRVQALDIL